MSVNVAATGSWLRPRGPEDGLSSFLWACWVLQNACLSADWLTSTKPLPLPCYEALPLNPSQRGRWSGCLPSDWVGLRLLEVYSCMLVCFLFFTINKTINSHAYTVWKLCEYSVDCLWAWLKSLSQYTADVHSAGKHSLCIEI